MGLVRLVHYFGSFLLLAAAILFLISSISSPVVDRISMMTVYLGGNADRSPYVTFGTFGWCVRGNGINNGCSRSMVGYNIFDVLANIVGRDDNRFERWASATANGLTNVMVLHPVAAGLAFISFILSLIPGLFGGILAMLATLLTFIVAIVVVVCDFVIFAYVRDQVNDVRNDNFWTTWGAGTWTALAGLVLLFIAFIITFITCCAGRREKKRTTVVKEERVGDYGTPARRRHFWQRR